MSSKTNIPLGFRFCPTDDELIKYLVWKINGTPTSGDDLIIHADIFGKTPPWSLFNTNGDIQATVKYFFTSLKKKSLNGSNFKRTVDHIGTWKGETHAVEIKDPQTGDVIGEKKTFTFKPNINNRDISYGDCKWLMTEYALPGVNVKHKKSDSNDYVLCRIKKKSKSKKHQQEEEDVELQQNNIMDDHDRNNDVAAVANTSTSTIPQNLENMAVNSNYILPCASNTLSSQYYNSINPIGVEQYYNYNYYNFENPHLCLDECVDYSSHPFNVENNSFNPFEDVLGQPVDDVLDAEIVAKFLLEDFSSKPEN